VRDVLHKRGAALHQEAGNPPVDQPDEDDGQLAPVAHMLPRIGSARVGAEPEAGHQAGGYQLAEHHVRLLDVEGHRVPGLEKAFCKDGSETRDTDAHQEVEHCQSLVWHRLLKVGIIPVLRRIKEEHAHLEERHCDNQQERHGKPLTCRVAPAEHQPREHCGGREVDLGDDL